MLGGLLRRQRMYGRCFVEPDPFVELTRQFWHAYEAIMRPAIGDAAYDDLVARGLQYLAGCAWARIDGTSKVDYLTDPARQSVVRSWCRALFRMRPRTWQEAQALLEEQLHP